MPRCCVRRRIPRQRPHCAANGAAIGRQVKTRDRRRVSDRCRGRRQGPDPTVLDLRPVHRLEGRRHGGICLQRDQRPGPRELRGRPRAGHAPRRPSSSRRAACWPDAPERAASGEEGARATFKKVKPKSLQIFARQLATMIEAGVSIVAALVTLEEQTDDKYLREVIGEVRSDVEAGMVLSRALSRHPKVFNRLFVSMVEAGESSGTLDAVLDRVATQIEKETQLKRRVSGAMVYPAVVLSFATLVLIFMLLFIVPVFEKVFSDLGGELPAADEDRDGRLGCAAWLLVHHLPRPDRDRLRTAEAEAHGERPAELGQVQAENPDEDRRRRPEGGAGALLADALDARRGRRRHHPGARDHRHDRRQLGDRAVARRTCGRACTKERGSARR